MRHPLWEQGSPEAYSEVLSGCLGAEAEALQDRVTEYEEARRAYEGSDPYLIEWRL